MKKILLIAVLLSLVLAACGGGDAVEQAIATAEGVAQDVSSAAEDAIGAVTGDESEAVEEGSPAETDAIAKQPVVPCDVDAIESVAEYDVTLRFVNATGAPMTVYWVDINQTPPTPQMVFELENGDSRDEGTWEGHEFLMKDEHGEMLKSHTVSASAKQCAVVYPHFGYEGDEPEAWAELSDYYEMCGTGDQQSPIDLTNATSFDVENIVFEYGDTAVNIINNGHTIQVNVTDGSQIMITSADGETLSYPLLQFHFHAPSEHEVDGQPYPIEMHLVHLIPGNPNKIAVVGVFIMEGAENSAFAPVWESLPVEENGTMATDATVQLAGLLPENQIIYRYSGSLTTPPCSEKVVWSVMQNPVEMSAEQIAAFTAIIEGNNRPLQPINVRDLQLDETP